MYIREMNGVNGLQVLLEEPLSFAELTEREQDPQCLLNMDDLKAYQVLDAKNLVLYDNLSQRLVFATFHAPKELDGSQEVQEELFCRIAKTTLKIARHSVKQSGICVGLLFFF